MIMSAAICRFECNTKIKSVTVVWRIFVFVHVLKTTYYTSMYRECLIIILYWKNIYYIYTINMKDKYDTLVGAAAADVRLVLLSRRMIRL